MESDRGLTALTAAIHSLHHHITIANGQPSPDFDGEFASAILGERRVFLPEGLGLMRSNAEGLIAVGKQLVCAEAEIARLRVMLGWLIAAAETVEWVHRTEALDAALAAAKETP
jgi:hypothetical protein